MLSVNVREFDIKTWKQRTLVYKTISIVLVLIILSAIPIVKSITNTNKQLMQEIQHKEHKILILETENQTHIDSIKQLNDVLTNLETKLDELESELKNSK